MKTDGFNAGISSAMGKLAALGATAAKIIGAAGIAGGGAAGFAIAKSIGKAADIETLTMAFAPLLGSIKAAKDRMAELDKFSNETPFELPEVANASRTLETLTQGALSAGKGLTMVGDAAAVANRPFEEVANNIGRLYSGLQNGREVGEAMQQLSQLGVISTAARQKIEEMRAAGGKGESVWAIATQDMSRFSGAMLLQATTWNGLMSNLSGSIGTVMASFGTPIMDSLKPYLEMLTARIDAIKASAVEMGKKIGDAFATVRAAFQSGDLTELIGNSLVLAAIDAVNAFSGGIRGIIAYLAAAMKSIMESIGGSESMQRLVIVFETASRAIGSSISAAILGALSNVPGMGNLTKAADRERNTAGMNWQITKAAVTGTDGGKLAKEAADAAAAANQAGMAAWRKTTANPLLDRSQAAANQAATLAKIQPQKDANQKAYEAKMAELEKRIAAGKLSPIEGGDAAGKPKKDGAVDRLAQIGGYVGGAANGMAASFAEKTVQNTKKMVSQLDLLLKKPLSSSLF